MTEAFQPGLQSHPLEPHHPPPPPPPPHMLSHSAPSAQIMPIWYHFAEESLHRVPEVELKFLCSCPTFQNSSPQHAQAWEGSFLTKSRTHPHGFGEISSIQDKGAVKKTFSSALTAQPKQMLTVNHDTCTVVSAALYAAHFLRHELFARMSMTFLESGCP